MYNLVIADLYLIHNILPLNKNFVLPGKSASMTARPRFDCWGGIQFGRVPFGVLSTSRFAPPALSSFVDDPIMSNDSQGALTDLL